MADAPQDERLREETKPLERLLARGVITRQEFEAAKNKILGGERDIICATCGTSNSQAAVFCFNCGTRLVAVGAAPSEAHGEIETSKSMFRAKAVRRAGTHTLEAEYSNWTGIVKIRVDGREIVSRFVLWNPTEVVSVGNRKFVVKVRGTIFPNITIEAVEAYEPTGKTGTNARFGPRNLALGGLASYAAFLVMVALGSQHYRYDPPAGFVVLIVLLASLGSLLLIAAPVKWLLERRR